MEQPRRVMYIPTELLREIVRHADSRDIGNLRITCARIHAICEERWDVFKVRDSQEMVVAALKCIDAGFRAAPGSNLVSGLSLTRAVEIKIRGPVPEDPYRTMHPSQREPRFRPERRIAALLVGFLKILSSNRCPKFKVLSLDIRGLADWQARDFRAQIRELRPQLKIQSLFLRSDEIVYPDLHRGFFLKAIEPGTLQYCHIHEDMEENRAVYAALKRHHSAHIRRLHIDIRSPISDTQKHRMICRDFPNLEWLSIGGGHLEMPLMDASPSEIRAALPDLITTFKEPKKLKRLAITFDSNDGWSDGNDDDDDDDYEVSPCYIIAWGLMKEVKQLELVTMRCGENELEEVERDETLTNDTKQAYYVRDEILEPRDDAWPVIVA